MKKTIIADVIVIPVLAMAGISGYWLLIDDESPSDLHYQHPRFLSREVHSRETARSAEVIEARTGDRVWRYIEYTLAEPALGRIYRRWVCDGAQAVQEPVKSNIGRVGDHSISISLDVPFVARRPVDCEWRQTIEYQRNPLTTVRIDYPPIKLRILPP